MSNARALTFCLVVFVGMIIIIFSFTVHDSYHDIIELDLQQQQLVQAEIDRKEEHLPSPSPLPANNDRTQLAANNVSADDAFNHTDNPLLHSLECRNAILEHDQVVLTPRIEEKAASCIEFHGIYTREGLDAFNHSQCSWRGNMVRSHSLVTYQLQHNHNDVSNNTIGFEWLTDFPVYFMLPKAGSSSIWKILKSINKHTRYGDIAQTHIDPHFALTNAHCAFTFVRSPVDRVLSGYYTINAQLWRSMDSSFDNMFNQTWRDMDRHKNFPNWTFISVYGEPQRFRTFVQELVAEPKRFTDSMHVNHILSATEVFQQNLGNPASALKFIGKVENFNEDFVKLMSLCPDSFSERDAEVIKKDFISHQMAGFGWGYPKSWQEEWEYHYNWLQSMDLFALYNYWKQHGHINNILPPAHFAMDRDTFQKVVDYYFQDITCFGYTAELNYESYLAKLKGKKNIYEMSEYNFVPAEP